MFSKLTKKRLNNMKNIGLGVAIKALEEAKKVEIKTHSKKADFFNQEILKDKHTRLCLESLSDLLGIDRLKVGVVYDEFKGIIINWNLITKEGVVLKEFLYKDTLIRYIKITAINEDENELKALKKIYISKCLKEELSEEI